MDITKKEIELYYLNEFLNASGLIHKVTTITEYERPDFLLKLNKKYIGIEVTTYYKEIGRKGSRRKSQEKVWSSLQDKLSSITSGTPIDHLIIFCSPMIINDKFITPEDDETQNLVDELRQFVNEIIERSTNFKDIIRVASSDIPDNRSYIKKFVRRIQILPVSASISGNWRFTTLTGGVIEMKEIDLENIIIKKKRIAVDYDKTKFDELWLLITAPADTPASAGSFNMENVGIYAEGLTNICNDSGFDQIWYFSGIGHRTLRLFPFP